MEEETVSLISMSRVYQATKNAIAALEQLHNTVNINGVDESVTEDINKMIGDIKQLESQSLFALMAIQRNAAFMTVKIFPDAS